MSNQRLPIRFSHARTSQTSALLKTTLSIPNLPQVLAQMNPLAVVKLVQDIGVEDCAEVLECLNPEQLLQVLEEDLWQSKRAGEPEKFKIKQALRWLHVWSDLGPDHFCPLFESLGRGFLATLVMHFARVRELKGMAWDLLDLDAVGSPLTDKDLQFRNIFDRFDLQARRHDKDQWELFMSIVNQLWESIPDFWLETLELCCNRSMQDEHDEEKKGRSRVSEVEENLRDDLAFAREIRRRMAGYIDPEAARDLLRRIRNKACSPTDLKIFLLQNTPKQDSAPLTTTEQQEEQQEEKTYQPHPEKDVEEIIHTARQLEMTILENTKQTPLLAGSGAQETTGRPLTQALRHADREGQNLMKIQQEIAGLANLLLAGSNIANRKFEKEEAFEAAMSLLELGLDCSDRSGEYRFPAGGPGESFQRGLLKLHESIALPIAHAFDEIVRSRQPQFELVHRTWIEAGMKQDPGRTSFALLIRQGFYFELARFFKRLEGSIASETAFCLWCLMSEFPVMPKIIQDHRLPKTSRDWVFITEPRQFEIATLFVEHLAENL